MPTTTALDLLRQLRAAPTWHNAACADHPHPENWFPHPTDPYDDAAEICDGCPIQEQCLRYGRDAAETGVWGGVALDRGRPRP